VVRFPDGFADTWQALLEKKIVAGLPWNPIIRNCRPIWLMCVTETSSKDGHGCTGKGGDIMKNKMGTTGLIFNEPLLVGKRLPGRKGSPLPRRDVDPAPLDGSLVGDGPDFPDLGELDVVRHFTKLSQWNFGVDSGMYPLGSCTMKYNPKTNERQASMPGLPAPTPCCPKASPRAP
jgi:hypothetical protein